MNPSTAVAALCAVAGAVHAVLFAVSGEPVYLVISALFWALSAAAAFVAWSNQR